MIGREAVLSKPPATRALFLKFALMVDTTGPRSSYPKNLGTVKAITKGKEDSVSLGFN